MLDGVITSVDGKRLSDRGGVTSTVSVAREPLRASSAWDTSDADGTCTEPTDVGVSWLDGDDDDDDGDTLRGA
jgi:hypothetical protein